MVGLMFVNVSHPVQLSDIRARRQVRSHISKRQHEQKRIAIERAVGKIEHSAQDQDDHGSTSNAGSSTPYLTTVGGVPDTLLDTTCESTTKQEEPTRLEAYLMDPCNGTSIPHGPSSCGRRSPDRLQGCNATELSRSERNHQHQHHTTEPFPTRSIRKGHTVVANGIRRSKHRSSAIQGPVAADNAEQTTHTLATYSQPTHNAYHTLDTTTHAPTPRIQFSLEDSSDELQPFFKQMGTSMTALLHHHNTLINTIGPACEHDHALPEGYMRSQYKASMHIEPVARAVILLASASNMSLHQYRPFRSAALYSLRGHAISSMRRALDDPKRCVSDAVILAVVTFAVSELLHGRREDCEVHLRGLERIRKIRGEGADQALERMLSCVSRLTAVQISGWTSVAYS